MIDTTLFTDTGSVTDTGFGTDGGSVMDSGSVTDAGSLMKTGSVMEAASLEDTGSLTIGSVSKVDSVPGHGDGVEDRILHAVKCLII